MIFTPQWKRWPNGISARIIQDVADDEVNGVSMILRCEGSTVIMQESMNTKLSVDRGHPMVHVDMIQVDGVLTTAPVNL